MYQLLLRRASSSDHNTDAGRSPRGLGRQLSIDVCGKLAARRCCYRSSGQTDGHPTFASELTAHDNKNNTNRKRKMVSRFISVAVVLLAVSSHDHGNIRKCSLAFSYGYCHCCCYCTRRTHISTASSCLFSAHWFAHVRPQVPAIACGTTTDFSARRRDCYPYSIQLCVLQE